MTTSCCGVRRAPGADPVGTMGISGSPEGAAAERVPALVVGRAPLAHCVGGVAPQRAPKEVVRLLHRGPPERGHRRRVFPGVHDAAEDDGHRAAWPTWAAPPGAGGGWARYSCRPPPARRRRPSGS
eukprot:CAMPEP_0179254358 /NCGR_PEP_ID=MMETSP0797-20121207/23199_1 /TAXON_ID=47934 /ORGANISM="Dinophysis acuminata, Strain DAEP01" /LENGTH=125 /DNA_ID=CAMNT_0020962237 /DNA_START=541 /DNA_END=915 /DNA_ORIENTATION=-